MAEGAGIEAGKCLLPVPVRGGLAAPFDPIGGRAPLVADSGGKVRVRPGGPPRQALVLSALLHLGAGFGGLMAWRDPAPGPMAAALVVQVTWIASASDGPATPAGAGAILALPVLADTPLAFAASESDPARSAPADLAVAQPPAAPSERMFPDPPEAPPGTVAQPAPVEDSPDIQPPPDPARTQPTPSREAVSATAVTDPTDLPIVPHPDPVLPSPPDPVPTFDTASAAVAPSSQDPDSAETIEPARAPDTAPTPPRRLAAVAPERPRAAPAPKALAAPALKIVAAAAQKVVAAPPPKTVTAPTPKASSGTPPGSADTSTATTDARAQTATTPGSASGPVANASPAKAGAAAPGGPGSGGSAPVAPGASLKDLGAGVRAAIDQRKRYPERAGASGLRGTVRLEVRIDAQGQLLGARVVASSGASLLDHAALAAAVAVPRYPAARAEHGPGPFTFVLPIAFRPG